MVKLLLLCILGMLPSSYRYENKMEALAGMLQSVLLYPRLPYKIPYTLYNYRCSVKFSIV
jgi:hypothetical protein